MKRVSKTTARKTYEEGGSIYMCGSLAKPNKLNSILVNKCIFEEDFDAISESYRKQYCHGSSGYRVHYYETNSKEPTERNKYFKVKG